MPQQHVSGSEQIWMNLHLPYKYLYQFTTNCKFVYYFAPARQVRVPPVLLALKLFLKSKCKYLNLRESKDINVQTKYPFKVN
jgi:hypothetical protein